MLTSIFVDLMRRGGHQISHWIILKFQKNISKAVNFYLRHKIPNILALNVEYFLISLHRTPLNEINILYTWVYIRERKGQK